MYFSKIAILFPFVLALAVAVPTPGAEADAAPLDEAEADAYPFELDNQLAKRSFGCPFSAQQCNDHVRITSCL